MGFFSRLVGAFRKATTTDRDGWFVEWAGGGKTSSGVIVTPDSAMRTAAVWACVRVRSEDIGKLPVILYQRQADGGKKRAADHPMYRLIHDQPNPRMTAFEFRQMGQAQTDLRGNAYAWKETDGRGQIVALWPLDPAKVQVFKSRDGKELFYRVELMDGRQVMLPAEEIMHRRGMTLDGCVGLSPVAHHRETIGKLIAADKYGAAFFGNNAQPMGALKMAPVLSDEARAALRTSWKERHLGKRELAILDGGMEWMPTGMTNEDAQYVDVINASNSDIWRIYRVPPHKVGDLSKATFSNIEQQSLEYVTDCLMSEMVSWEQTFNRDLLTDEEKAAGYYFEFLPDALLRGDLKSRYDAYAIARNWGVLSVNDIRDRENMNHVENGDIYLQPLNMIEAGKEPPPPAPPSPAAAKLLIAYAQQVLRSQELTDA